MPRTIRIGTRDSELAVWQATRVQDQLKRLGQAAELHFIKSQGDLDLQSPLHQMGGQGVFTQVLNVALLNQQIDIAVHSMKDMPTQLPAGIRQCSVLKRGPVRDLLVFREDGDWLKDEAFAATVATGSLRRRAQWLARFPRHRIVDLRGNVNTRMAKLAASEWDGAIFAQAGLERIGLRPPKSIVLDWMLPAPAQGAIQVVCREADRAIFEVCQQFSDPSTDLCTRIERDFMRRLEGGCASPIGALATVTASAVHLTGNLTAPDGRSSVSVQKVASHSEAKDLGVRAAEELLGRGGQAIMEDIRKANP